MTRDELLRALLERLWQIYCERVEYARRYVELVTARHGRVVNDHIAFRTLDAKTGSQPAGIAGIDRIFKLFGYTVAGSYEFPGKHLIARHYAHPMPEAPKIFISQLQVNELPEDVQALIRGTVAEAVDRFEPCMREELAAPEKLSAREADALVDGLVSFFTELPWQPPRADIVRLVNGASQYGAWTLLHGNNVNHFTASINEQRVPDWPDIDATIAGLRAAGVPMKAEIEGARGGKLRQTATEAVDVDCRVRDENAGLTTMRWSYAYYELAERGYEMDEDGRKVRFEGFLGSQATNLFEMTRR